MDEKEFKKLVSQDRLESVLDRLDQLSPENEDDRRGLAELCVWSVVNFAKRSPFVAFSLVVVGTRRTPEEVIEELTESLKDKEYFEEIRRLFIFCWEVDIHVQNIVPKAIERVVNEIERRTEENPKTTKEVN